MTYLSHEISSSAPEQPWMTLLIFRNLRKECQMLLFSATYENQVMRFAEAIVPNPITIRLRREEESLDNIKQCFIQCQTKDDKFRALSNIYGSLSIGQSMIFCHVSAQGLTFLIKITCPPFEGAIWPLLSLCTILKHIFFTCILTVWLSKLKTLHLVETNKLKSTWLEQWNMSSPGWWFPS